MSTEELYLMNPYLRKCEATVLKVEKVKGKRAYLTLDKTIFHPLAGGQPSDEGIVVGGNGVFEVRKAVKVEDEVKLLGVFKVGQLAPGDHVTCELDWSKRYKVMRLHTAGHILDYAMMKFYGRLVETLEAFHGPPEAYLVYDVESEPEKSELERIVSEIVSSSLPVFVRNVPASELQKTIYNAPNLSRLPLREIYRVVEISSVNAMPCTGTHVANTSEVGSFSIKSVKMVKGCRIAYDVE
ncbi:MAG: alanyl-tRNA editing protein [Thermofilaceae archaeon]|nr:alanyl-tRNA editing protein [Thermofilaceae archaeon]